jgi:hypothetical protein
MRPTERQHKLADVGVSRLSLVARVGPAALALLIYSGQLKSNPLLSWVPIDLTALAAAITVICIVHSRIYKGPAKWSIVIPTAIFLLLSVGLANSNLQGYPLSKAQFLFTLTLLVAMAPFYLLREREQRSVFLVALVAIATVVALVTVAFPATASESSVSVVFEGANTIGTARISGTGALILAVFALAANMRLTHRLGLMALAAGLAGLMLSSGSRGPFLGIAAGLAVVLAFSPRFAKYRIQAIAATAVAFLATLAWSFSRSAGGAGRVFGFLSGEQNTSSLMREQFWGAAVESILRNPFGVGIGNFSSLPGQARYATERGRLYPHNLMLEIFVEIGVIAGIAFIIYVLASGLKLAITSVEPTLVVLTALFAFSFVNAMVSGDINDNRLLWICLSVPWVLGVSRKDAIAANLRA